MVAVRPCLRRLPSRGSAAREALSGGAAEGEAGDRGGDAKLSAAASLDGPPTAAGVPDGASRPAPPLRPVGVPTLAPGEARGVEGGVVLTGGLTDCGDRARVGVGKKCNVRVTRGGVFVSIKTV